MTPSKYLSDDPLLQEHQPSSRRETDQWAESCQEIVDRLSAEPIPTTADTLEMVTMRGHNAVLIRLNELIDAGTVRRREDGPDGRVTYYEPGDRWHVSWGGGWGADIGLVTTVRPE